MARRGNPRSRLSQRVISSVRVKPQLRYTGGPFTRVRFFSLRPKGVEIRVEIIGDLFLKDGRIVADPPDRIALRNVLAEPVWLPEGDGWWFIYPDTQPEEYLKGLLKQYGHGTYFWAEAVAMNDDTQEDRP